MSATIVPEIISERRFWSTPASSCFMGNNVDEDIVPLLKQLNARHWMVTTSCCSGHSDKYPYVSVAVKVEYMKKLVDLLNSLKRHLEDEDVYIDCELIFGDDIATSCDFDNFPDWLMFHIDFLVDDGFKTNAAFWERAANAVTQKPRGAGAA